MTSAAYNQWLRDGRPYTLVRPAKALQAKLRGHGLTVYDFPDDAHLKANVPEDHTPFSATGWPGTNRKYNARGLDIMPRGSTAADRAENAAIARRIIADKNAGVPGTEWIKYLNWTDENGICRQERWTPNHTTRSSSDRGHIHISGRSDIDNDSRADGYDPIARMTGGSAVTAPLTLDTIHISPDGTPRKLGTLLAEGHNLAVFGVSIAGSYPASATSALQRLEAAAAADATRDAATLAAIEALAAAVTALQAGGSTDLDTAAVLRAIADAADTTRTYVEQLQADLNAAAEREADLRARLADAFGPGSE